MDELRSSGEGGGEVQGQALARRRIEALKVKLAAAAERLGDANFQQLRQDLAHVEYNFHVGTIFIENFLNGEVSVTPDNIDEKEKETRSALECFEAWRLASLQLKQQGNPAWEQSFISTTTYKNLRIGVCGFFQYCRLVFLLPNPPSYVKFLHANQSSLEATFSHIRYLGGDSVHNYPSAITAINSQDSIQIMNESNPNYEGDTTEVAVSWNRLESVMGRTDDRRALVVKSWRDETGGKVVARREKEAGRGIHLDTSSLRR